MLDLVFIPGLDHDQAVVYGSRRDNIAYLAPHPEMPHLPDAVVIEEVFLAGVRHGLMLALALSAEAAKEVRS